MPFPNFDGILNVLPPHVGDPTQPNEISPYPCTSAELCDFFATSPERKLILEGFLKHRKELLNLGIQGFQWLDGSFLENIEVLERRPPRDIDVVTFVDIPNNDPDLTALQSSRPDLFERDQSKANFSVDHFLLPLYKPPRTLVAFTRYWYGLFSHRRDPDRVWKGMLAVELSSITDDDPAWHVLRSKP